MVHNLFDEYRFFPNYPDPELDTTAALFGALLHHQLLTNITLGMALRHVLQALAQPPNSKMFRFGLGAINQFKSELHLWPKFCERALAIPHLKSVDPALCSYMEKIVRAGGEGSAAAAASGDTSDLTGAASSKALGPGEAAEAAAASTKDAAPPAAADNMANGINSGGKSAVEQPNDRQGKGGGKANGPGHAAAAGGTPAGKGAGKAHLSSVENVSMEENLREIMRNADVAQAAASMALAESKPAQYTLHMTLNNETLDTAERKRSETAHPNDALADKVSFLMNNITVDNMPTKSKELQSVVIPKYVEWFANYLVVKRAAQVRGLSLMPAGLEYLYCCTSIVASRVAVTAETESSWHP